MNLDRLLAAGGPFIDLRSPEEFASGAVPGATNLPLLSDDERHQVGLTYKQDGQAAAIARGHSLVSGELREQRMSSWLAFAETHPDAWLYCWRGGLRSETVQHWLAEVGVTLPRVEGGFKALRHACLAVLDRAPGEKPWYVLGGRTGTGKTLVLNRLHGSIDLEGLANHRGSAFGAALSPQPPPIGFENALAVAYLRHSADCVILEDESRTIGRLAIPPEWHAAMQQAPLVILEADMASRARRIEAEYVRAPLAEGLAAATLHSRLQRSLDRIGRRLGGVRSSEVRLAMDRGFGNGDHLAWIVRLLEWYYDPMYDYQLERKRDRIIFRGDEPGTRAYLENLTVSAPQSVRR